jgi:hypothetical protein
MLQLPSTPTQTSRRRASRDPILDLIAAHQQSMALAHKLYGELEEAENAAEAEHGRRPIALIRWRNYHIGDSEIDRCREDFLSRPGGMESLEGGGVADRDEIEREYVDAKRRYKAKVRAIREWDRRTGLAAQGRQKDNAYKAADRIAARMSKTKPLTAGGAAALIRYLLDDDLNTDVAWHMAALETAAGALVDIDARAMGTAMSERPDAWRRST